VNAAVLTLLVLILAALAFVIARFLKDQPAREELARLRVEEATLKQVNSDLRTQAGLSSSLVAEKARLEATLEHERRTSSEKIELLQSAEDRLKKEFENLANRIFEERGNVLTEQGKKQTEAALGPFKTQLEEFRKRAEEIHNKENDTSVTLVAKIMELQNLSDRVSKDANSLATAIRADVKTQGSWGEFVIERVFEASGLERDKEYKAQEQFHTDDDKLEKPDFTIYLPGDRAVFLDSKVSLTDYERYASSPSGEEAERFLKAHVESVRRQIDVLEKKSYEKLLGDRSLDFVIMCIPIEPAFLTALQANSQMILDAAKKRVVVVGPSTLLFVLKLVDQIWQREKEAKNRAEIIKVAAGIYEQVHLVIESYGKVATKMQSLEGDFETLEKRLKTGRGSLAGRAEQMRTLGLAVKKALSGTAIQDLETEVNGSEEESGSDTQEDNNDLKEEDSGAPEGQP
jgi:DNA recombination protein RmuC